MKTVSLFILFVVSVTLAGIGIEDHNTIAFAIGIVCVALSILIMFYDIQNETSKTKTDER